MLGHYAYSNPLMPPGYDMDTDAKGGHGPYANQPAINSFTNGRNSILAQPHIVYLVMGTNPLGGSESNISQLESVIQEMERGIREIASLSPDSLILLGAVPTSLPAPNLIANYNQRQSALAAELKAEGLSIEFWDAMITADEIRLGIDPSGLHMSDAGMIRFGGVAFNAGRDYMLRSGACD